MNQIHQAEDFAPGGPTAVAPDPKVAAKPTARLTEADAKVVQATLIQGDDGLARRKDLGEMFKRIVAMHTTLDTGLNDRQDARATASQAALSTRLDKVEQAINGVEGVLRIELEPLVQAAVGASVDRVLQGAGLGRRRGLRGKMSQAVLLVAALTCGVVYSSEISGFAMTTKDAVAGMQIFSGLKLPLIGGIGTK